MKAIILVGGQGTRLRPLTVNTPKAMVPVLNKPFLEHVINHLSQHNVKDIILTQGHLSQPIESYFGDGSRFGVRLTYVIEESPLGTAGAVKNSQSHLTESFLVLNGDIFTNLDISAMIDFHRQQKAMATIALTPVEDPTRYGLVETDEDGRILRFMEKPRPEDVTTNMINAGTYVLEPQVLDKMPPQQEYSFERQVFPKLLQENETVFSFASNSYWTDIGHPEHYLKLNLDLLSEQGSSYGFPKGTEVIIGKDSQVDAAASITGPVLIGQNCFVGTGVQIKGPTVIGDNCRLEENALVTESVIWQNTFIGAGSQVIKSVVADNCRLDSHAIAQKAVLGDRVSISSGGACSPGAKIWPGESVS